MSMVIVMVMAKVKVEEYVKDPLSSMNTGSNRLISCGILCSLLGCRESWWGTIPLCPQPQARNSASQSPKLQGS
jgi:hypothetical protein